MLKAKVTSLAANQFIITTSEGNYLQSYSSIIVFVDNKGNAFLDEKFWDYSRTTGKYRNQFLNEDKKTTLKKLQNGTYKYANLN